MIPTIDTSFHMKCFTDGRGNLVVYVPEFNLTVVGASFEEAKAEAKRQVAEMLEASFNKSMSPPSPTKSLWQRLVSWISG